MLKLKMFLKHKELVLIGVIILIIIFVSVISFSVLNKNSDLSKKEREVYEVKEEVVIERKELFKVIKEKPLLEIDFDFLEK